jgi:hypothetical protein
LDIIYTVLDALLPDMYNETLNGLKTFVNIHFKMLKMFVNLSVTCTRIVVHNVFFRHWFTVH